MKLKMAFKYLSLDGLKYLAMFFGLFIALDFGLYTLANALLANPFLPSPIFSTPYLYYSALFFGIVLFSHGLTVFIQLNISRRTMFIALSLTFLWLSLVLTLAGAPLLQLLVNLRGTAASGSVRTLLNTPFDQFGLNFVYGLLKLLFCSFSGMFIGILMKYLSPIKIMVLVSLIVLIPVVFLISGPETVTYYSFLDHLFSWFTVASNRLFLCLAALVVVFSIDLISIKKIAVSNK